VVSEGSASATEVGALGQLSPAIADARGLSRQERLFVAELNLDKLANARVATGEATRPLPRHPSSVRDLSIAVEESLSAGTIRGTIHAVGRSTPAPLVGLAFFDRYQGAGVQPGRVSLSVHLTFQAADRTLT